MLKRIRTLRTLRSVKVENLKRRTSGFALNYHRLNTVMHGYYKIPTGLIQFM